MRLTIIIPSLANKRTKPYLEACVISLRETTPWHRILVVTNGDQVQDLDIDADVVHVDKQGQCGAVNRGLEMVDTQYVMVSNDDMIYGPGWDDSLSRTVPKYRCVSPTLVEPKAGAPPFYIYNCGVTIKQFDKKRWHQYIAQMRIGEDEEEDIEDGFNLPFLTETEIFRTIGGYDEEYDPGGSNSDPDTMHKMMIAGIAPKRDFMSLVYHFSLGSGAMGVDKISWWHNWRYFPQKWGFERDGRNNIWYAGGKNGTRIPTKDRPYVDPSCHGHGTHPGKDWLEYSPPWTGIYGHPVYGEGEYYGQ